jgi:hypothetical protein
MPAGPFSLAIIYYQPIRVNGDATWHRTEEGKWKITRLLVQSYAPLDNRELQEVVAELRAVKVKWPDDSLEQLQAMRGQAA